MTEDDKKQLELANKNIAKAFGQTEFNALISSLQADADISVKAPK
jgi:peptidyl-prolyl cis-trans isomerase D